jgi:hypothetical protein|tara:strand:+ start:230 stop:421 length:192 start_codon:yes stop_codon:yes gene_type:complete
VNSVKDLVRRFIDATIELAEDMNSWLKEFIDDIAWKYNLSTYQMTWLGFADGVILVVLLQWLF